MHRCFRGRYVTTAHWGLGRKCGRGRRSPRLSLTPSRPCYGFPPITPRASLGQCGSINFLVTSAGVAAVFHSIRAIAFRADRPAIALWPRHLRHWQCIVLSRLEKVILLGVEDLVHTYKRRRLVIFGSISIYVQWNGRFCHGSSACIRSLPSMVPPPRPPRSVVLALRDWRRCRMRRRYSAIFTRAQVSHLVILFITLVVRWRWRWRGPFSSSPSHLAEKDCGDVHKRHNGCKHAVRYLCAFGGTC